MESFTTSSHNQLALLETSTNQSEGIHLPRPSATEKYGIDIRSPRPRLAGHFFALLHDSPLSSSASSTEGHKLHVPGPTALKISSGESTATPVTSLFGPIGAGRGIDYPASHENAAVPSNSLLLPKSDVGGDKYIYQTCRASTGPTLVPNGGIEPVELLQHNATYIREQFLRPLIVTGQPPGSQETFDQALRRLEMHSLIDTGTPPKSAPHLFQHPFHRASPSVRTVYPPRIPPPPNASLFSCVGQQLDSLDGTFRMQKFVCDRVLLLSMGYGLSEAIPIVVRRVLESGVTQSFPYNTYIAGFCRYFLPKVSRVWMGQSIMEPYKGLIRSTFISTFIEWWSLPPKLGSMSEKFLIRVASFYGHLYLVKALNQEAFRACLAFLCRLTPLPIEGLRFLLSGDISSYPRLSP